MVCHVAIAGSFPPAFFGGREVGRLVQVGIVEKNTLPLHLLMAAPAWLHRFRQGLARIAEGVGFQESR